MSGLRCWMRCSAGWHNYSLFMREDGTAAMKLWVLDWAEQERLDAVAMQCWTAIQHSLGISPCFVHAELTDAGLPVACETDIHGAITSTMLYAASKWSRHRSSPT